MRHNVTRSLVCLAVLTFICPSAPTSAKDTDWEHVTGAFSNGEHYYVQIEKGSIRRLGTKVTYWVRMVKGAAGDEGNPYLQYVEPTFGPSLYQDDCSSGQLRIMQGSVLWGYEGVIPLNRPAGWQYIAPDSLASEIHRHVCPKAP